MTKEASMKFSPGDKVVRFRSPTNQLVVGKTYIVLSMDRYSSTLSITLKEFPENSYSANFFEHEHVYNSPLCEALR